MTTRKDFLGKFANLAEAMAFETRVLSIGGSLLPPCAIVVRDGGEPTDEYWRFLLFQLMLDEWSTLETELFGP